MNDFASLSEARTGKKMKVRALPARLVSGIGKVIGRWQPLVPDMGAMAEWFDTGKYVADTTRQAELFGDVPRAEDTVNRLAASLGH